MPKTKKTKHGGNFFETLHKVPEALKSSITKQTNPLRIKSVKKQLVYVNNKYNQMVEDITKEIQNNVLYSSKFKLNNDYRLYEEDAGGYLTMYPKYELCDTSSKPANSKKRGNNEYDKSFYTLIV